MLKLDKITVSLGKYQRDLEIYPEAYLKNPNSLTAGRFSL